jgi:hypothetical protein
MCFEFQHGLVDISKFDPSPLARDKILISSIHVKAQHTSQEHAPVHVLMRLCPINKSLVCCKAKEGRHVRISY